MAVLRELIANNAVFVYMNDVIIPSQDFEGGIAKLKDVLHVLLGTVYVSTGVNAKNCTVRYSSWDTSFKVEPPPQVQKRFKL